jgi:hypothetical protein
MTKKTVNDPDLELVAKARQAIKEAVADAIEDHRRTGDPIVVWKDGKVVELPAEQLSAQESHAEYTVKKRNGRGRNKK